jgi:hypothetical protein
MSGNTIATQSDPSNQPAYVAQGANGGPEVKFNGYSQNMLLSPLFSYFTGGSLFAVIKPSLFVSGATLIDIANGLSSDNVILDQPDATGKIRFHVFNGTTDSSISTTSSVMTVGNYALEESIQNGSGSATLYSNGAQTGSGSVNNINSVIRAGNFLGARNNGTNMFAGSLAELMFFNRAVTASEQGNIEAYLINKYQAFNQAPAAPTLSVPTGTLSVPTQVSIEAPAGVTCFFTTDGSAPTPSSPIYTGPIQVNFSQTLKAIAVQNKLQSSITSATYTLDATEWPSPSPSATAPVTINLQLPTMANPQ